MKCPHCAVELRLSERRNIEIDYCPDCRGVWLDRGELDKLLESSAGEPRRYEREDRDDDDHSAKLKSYKQKSFLSELFDF